MTTELSKEFEQLRDLYFSGLGSDWKVEASDCEGYCDIERRTILVKEKSETHKNRRVVLIHEMAHAVTNGSHDEEWIRRMEEAEKEAGGLGDHELATSLREEIDRVMGDNAYDVTPSEIYGEIHRAAGDMPDADFHQVARAVAQSYGLSLDVFLHDFPAVCDEFENARSFLQVPAKD